MLIINGKIYTMEDQVIENGYLWIKGKDADIAVFSGNPLEVFTKTLYTIIDGELVYNYSET